MARPRAPRKSKKAPALAPVAVVQESGVAPIFQQADRTDIVAPKPDKRGIDDLPIFAVVEHEGVDRWRVKGVGHPLTFGHGKTAAEAIADFYAVSPQVVAPA